MVVEDVLIALPPDVAAVLKIYGGAIVDHDPRYRGDRRFFVRVKRKSWGC
jgi:hypothetical protein